MDGNFSWRELLGWLAFFLFGIHLFSDSIKQVGSAWLKKFLRTTTNTPLKWILSGTLITWILQSSSVVAVMILWFVGANLIWLSSAIGAMIWASIGTTMTSWLVAVIGFKVDIAAFALPIITIAWFSIFIFNKKPTRKNLALFIFGFWLLLFGLDMMKDSVTALQEVFDMQRYLNIPQAGFILLGMILTIVLQSSSATNAITITSVSTWLIWLPIGMLLMLWSHIGTSFTSIIVWFFGTKAQKQVATVHVTFNIFAAIIWVLLIQPFFRFMSDVLHLAENDVIWLAVFHTWFNIIWAFLFYRFIPHFRSLLEKVFKDKKTLYLAVMDVDPSDSETWLLALRKDINDLAIQIIRYNVSFFSIDAAKLFAKNLDYTFSKSMLSPEYIQKMYNDIKARETYLIQYALQLKWQETINEKVSARIGELIYVIMQLVQSSKMLRDVYHNLQDIIVSDDDALEEQTLLFTTRVRNIYSDIIILLAVKEPVQTYQDILKIFLQIKKDDRSYITSVQHILKKEGLDSQEVSDLIRVNRYIYNSSKSFMTAMRDLFLNHEQRRALEGAVDQEIQWAIPLSDEPNFEDELLQSVRSKKTT